VYIAAGEFILLLQYELLLYDGYAVTRMRERNARRRELCAVRVVAGRARPSGDRSAVEHEKGGEQSARRKTVGRGPRSTGALRPVNARVQGLRRQERRVEGSGHRRGRFSGQTGRSVFMMVIIMIAIKKT